MRSVLKLLVAGAVSSAIAGAQQAPSAVTDWVKRNAIPLLTPQPGHGFDDLQPLKKVIGNARIVSLGEATHGTREFFQIKHRMMEFLASEMGFTIFSIEANMPEAYRLNEYVLTGKGDPARLLKGMYFWTWNTEEVLDMIRWMREFNQSGKGRVEFTGFDMQTPTVAVQIVGDFVRKNDPGYADGLRQASVMALAPARNGTASTFGGVTGTFPVADAAGKTVRFSGYIKTENVTGYAGLWWRVDGETETPNFVNLGGDAPKGTTDWRRYEVEIPVARNARNINFGALLAGDGTAWFDGLWVQLDGKAYESPAFDFDFEAESPRGLHIYGNGYQSVMDREEFHSGKQSLRVRRVDAAQPDTRATDPKVVASAWKNVMTHLEKSRASYIGRNVATGDIDWAIQNARVVLQCMQMRTSEVSRDQSMADNIQWILDHSPKAKIVLWAHNGHVATGGYRGYEPMGVSLRKAYGDQMVVFGFAFNQGSFQAVDQRRGLRNFTVPPSPEGSLDAALAASGIPLYALDLRQTPKTGPAAEWWGQTRKARTVGAVYSEDRPDTYFSDLAAPRSFDALFFVEKTTAARKNPELPPNQ